MSKAAIFTIDRFPIPPSANELYAFSRQAGRMIKTREYRNYEKAVYSWLTTNPEQIKGIREFLTDIGDSVIDISSHFHMPKKSIICLNGKPKRNDTSNRIKALHDALSSIILGVDDRYFWSGTFNKVVADDKSNGHVQIILKLRTINESKEVGSNE